MASIFGHAALATGLSGGFIGKKQYTGLIILGILSSMMPDLDVIGFQFGIPYESIWGHRGFTHSIFFALIWAGIICLAFEKKQRKRYIAFVYIFLCTISHGILDAMTTGGKGVGFLIPFTTERFFFPWQMIKVSPLGIERFFSARGLAVLKSEFVYIGIPALILGVSLYFLNRKKTKQ